MEKIKYAPVLKANRGEFNGFLDLNIDHQQIIFPIFELTTEKATNETQTKITKKLNSLEKSLLKFNKKIGITFGEHEEFVNKLINNYSQIIPVYENIKNGIKPRKGEKIIRIKFPINFNEFSVDELIEKIDNQTILQLDLDDVSNKINLRNSYSEVISCLNRLKDQQFNNRIIISLSSFPTMLDISSQDMLTLEEYDKIELNIFHEIKNKFQELDLIYSDYVITKYTDTIPFPKINMKKIPEKLKYSLEDNYIIFKGENEKEGERIKTTARKLAEEFLKTNYFKGEDFTVGSKNMMEFAKSSTNGNAEKLIRIGTTHHLELILKQLSLNL